MKDPNDIPICQARIPIKIAKYLIDDLHNFSNKYNLPPHGLLHVAATLGLSQLEAIFQGAKAEKAQDLRGDR